MKIKLLLLSVFILVGCNSEPFVTDKESKLGVIEFSGTTSPLNRWRVACTGRDKSSPNRGADKGSLTYSKSEDTWTFSKSRNYCSGGFFAQRAELTTDSIAPGSTKAYLFQADISFTSDSKERFTIFSLHDGRDGCAPPASLNVNPDGRLWIASDERQK